MSPALLVIVSLLGGVGAATRFVVDGLVRSRRPGPFPLATLVVNVSGSALLGGLTGAMLAGVVPTGLYLAVGVGFCGGYTTFSTAMAESVRLVQAGDLRRAVTSTLGSLALTLLAAAAGFALVRLAL